MRDVVLYRALLRLTFPWTVAAVDVDMKGQRVVVRVEPGPGPYPCPECGTAGARYAGSLGARETGNNCTNAPNGNR